MNEQKNSMKQKLLCVGLESLMLLMAVSVILLFVSVYKESDIRYKDPRGFLISTNGFEVTEFGRGLYMKCTGTEGDITITISKENLEEKESAPSMAKKITFKEKRLVGEDSAYVYTKNIFKEGKQFRIVACVPTKLSEDVRNGILQKLGESINSFSITKVFESKGGKSVLVGRWEHENAVTHDKPKNLELLKDGTGLCDNASISWKVDGNRLVLLSPLGGLACDYVVSGLKLFLMYDDGDDAIFMKRK